MIHKIFTIRDQKAEAYLQPFFSATNPTAIRAISDTVNDPNSVLCKHAEDYTLYLIGDFDDITGTITPAKTVFAVTKLIDLKQPELPFPPD